MSLKPRTGSARRSRKDTPATTPQAPARAAVVPTQTDAAAASSIGPDLLRSHTPTRLTHPGKPRSQDGTPAPGAGVPATGRLAIAWHRGDWELARDTYQYAWDHMDFTAEVPPAFAGWIADVLEKWATLTPERRTTILIDAAPIIEQERKKKIVALDAPLIAAGQRPDPDISKPRSYKVRPETFITADAARAEDSRQLHGQISRGQWARDALRAELARAVRHNNNQTLPVADRLTPSGRTTARPTLTDTN